jgi:hypothetical protein
MQGLTQRNTQRGPGHFSTEVKTFVKMGRTEYTQPERSGAKRHILFVSPERGPTRARESKNWCGEQYSVAPAASVFRHHG